MAHISLSIHDIMGNKKCDLYDSSLLAPGQAHTIVRTTELNGWKEQSFTLPHMINDKKNFRWKYIRSEFRVRIRVDKDEDWFTIVSPKYSHHGQISSLVTCYHVSSTQKTKNLYLSFDDTNGIDTCQNLVEKILAGTGWTLDTAKCDKFLENDGTTEKKRSLSSSGKVGAYQLITNVCGLFNAYPIYHGDTKTVELRALANKGKLVELVIGKDLATLDVTYNSDNIVTRLYVEGEYGDNGYVGIDDVNETKLPFLMNFDYYKEQGLFTDVHQGYVDAYYEAMTESANTIKEVMKSKTDLENQLNQLWGQPDFLMYEYEDSELALKYVSPGVDAEYHKLDLEDKVLRYWLEYDQQTNQDKPYCEYITYEVTTLFSAGDVVIKFITPTSGTIGAKETAIEAKETIIKEKNDELTEQEKQENYDVVQSLKIQQQISELNTQISGIKNDRTNEETQAVEYVGLYSNMQKAIGLVYTNILWNEQISTAQTTQAEAESTLAVQLGDMLRDGYWSNTNYIPGQESMLYADAVEMIAELSKPQVSYVISLAQATNIWGEVVAKYGLNYVARIYDPDLEINDRVFIDKIVEHIDDPTKSTIQISNNDLSITGKSFDSILGRISQLADLIDQKSSLYERAEAIGRDGSLLIDRLNGMIDVQKNKLLSTTSSWYTDDAGNIIFESVNGSSAMMLTGEGFMIANGRLDDGEWNWRTFGTGEGFTADMIVTGFLSAERIETASIGQEKQESNLKNKLSSIDLFYDSINSKVVLSETFKTAITDLGTVYVSPTPPEAPQEDDLWLDTSVAPPLLKRYGTDNSGNSGWVVVNDVSGLENLSNSLAQRIQIAEEKITSDAIINTVTQSNLYKNQLEETKQSAVTQTVDKFEIRFTEHDNRITQAAATAEGQKKDVNTWFKFNSDGLVIGKEDSPFMTKQDNEEYGFYYNDRKVAYMRGSSLNIPQAYARDVLRIGGLQGEVDSTGNITWKWVGLDN